MALGDEAAGGVDRQHAVRTGGARIDELAALALGAEAQHLALVDLAEAGRVVHLGDVDILRTEPGHLIGLVGRRARQAGLVERAVLAAGEADASDLDRALLHRRRQLVEILRRAQQRGRGTVADRRAHRAGQRIGHRPVLHHRLWRHLEAVLRLVVQGAVIVVLGGADGDLLLGRTVLPHVPLRLHGVGVHEDRAVIARLELRADHLADPVHLLDQPVVLAGDVALVEEVRGALRHLGREQLLDADAERQLVRAGQDVLPRAHEGGRGGGTGVLDVEHRHPLGEQPLLDQRLEQRLTADRVLPPEGHAAIAQPARFDVGAGLHAGILQGPEIGLAREVAEAQAGVLLEGRRVGTDDVNIAHFGTSRWFAGPLALPAFERIQAGNSRSSHMAVTAQARPPEVDATIAELKRLYGDRVTTAHAVREQHGKDISYHEAHLPDAVVFAESAEEVQAIVQVCARHKTPIIAFGTGTSLEGHISAPNGGISLDVSRMNRVLQVNEADLDVVVQPGVTRKHFINDSAATGLFFPIDPGADASIGGMTSTRASGTNAVRYGTMRENVLSLQVVTADGRLMRLGRRARKSSAGYDLVKLFVGSEGTLGIITEITLRLYGIPESMVAATCA